MKTQNLSIVFVDIAGFTPRTSSQTREENEAMLARFAQVVLPLVKAYRGKVVKTMGDAYLLTFGSPTDALLCSAAIHDRLAESDADIPAQDRFEIRCAVNVGEVRVEAGDIFGEAVNIAARIEGKAGPGEIYFSEAVYLAMTKSEVPAEDLGYFELKGIPEKVRLYRIPPGQGGGYDLKARDQNLDPAPPEASPALAPSALPFAGLGLNRVRDQLGRGAGPGAGLEVHMETAKGWVAQLPSSGRAGASRLKTFFQRWKVEVRRSRGWQIGTALVLAAVLALGWMMLRPEKKPLTPWQKLQRSLGGKE